METDMSRLFARASESFKAKNRHLGLLPHEKRLLGGVKERHRDIRKGMNKSERDFSLILAAQLVKGEISGWMYEGIKLRIGEGCFYTPDFMVWGNTLSGGVESRHARTRNGNRQDVSDSSCRSQTIPDRPGNDCHTGSGSSAPPAQTFVKFVETKGFLRDDARVKFLAAQEQHKWASFEMWRKDRKQGWTQIL